MNLKLLTIAEAINSSRKTMDHTYIRFALYLYSLGGRRRSLDQPNHYPHRSGRRGGLGGRGGVPGRR